MNRCGLGSADFKRYLEACALPHNVEVAVELQNNQGETLVSFDAGRGGGRDVIVTDGSVTVAASTSSGRRLDLTVLDPSRELMVAEEANYVNKMLNVKVGVNVAELAQVVWADVFTGPIYSAPRTGDVVQFTAHGKARFSMHGIRETYVVKKGTKKTTAVRKILHDIGGEPYNRMDDLPDAPAKLSDDLVLHVNNAKPWAVCRDLMQSLARHLTYDGPGNVRAQRIDLKTPVYEFTDADNEPGIVADAPTAQTDWSTVKNAVKLIGGSTKTTDAPIAYAYAPASNPFSAQKLGRGASEAYHWDIVRIKTVHTQSVAQKLANAHLERDLVANRQVKFESMPMYVFDELDLVEVQTPQLVTQTRLADFVIPLLLDGDPGPTMAYGWSARRSSNAFARRR